MTVKEATFSDWERYINDEPGFTPSQLKPYVLASWERCRIYGVDPETRGFDFVSPENLKARRDSNLDLIETAVPYVENLYQIIHHTGAIITLSDAENVIIHVDAQRDSRILKHFPKLGTDQSEKIAGSNGIGTALAARGPVEIVGADHWFRHNHNWACYAAPISYRGSIIGALDLTIPIEHKHSLSLGLVVSAVNGIERELELKKTTRELALMLEERDAVLSLIETGIILIDRDGTVKGTNSEVHKIFHDDRVWKGHPIEDFFKADRKLGPFNEAGVDYEMREVKATVRRKPKSMQVSCRLIMKDNEVAGAVLSVQPTQTVHNLVNRVTGSDAAYTFDDLIGQDASFKECLEHARVASHIDASVLITGESGTGKELFAQAIHNAGSRRNKPFITVNCGAVSRDLMLAELFGTSEGHNGAKGKVGKLELANGGTILLDDIHELPLDVQAKLLQTLQSGELSRVGSTDTKPINVRVIATSVNDLNVAVRNHRFRQNLLCLIGVFTISLPPLRARPTDIILLAESMLRRFAGPDLVFSPAALDALCQFDWSGNIRELGNVVERAYYLFSFEDRLDSEIGIDFLPMDLMISSTGTASNGDIRESQSSSRAIKEMQQTLLKRTLQEKAGNLRQTAQSMGVSRSTVYNLIEKYKLNVEDYRSH
ncbi:MAG: sigma 54-interacting transcriptional regulator [Pseudomonadota bacterium]|nr:sigma 54-interacting transcriptional regulator [Pseudomonadota bacterium]